MQLSPEDHGLWAQCEDIRVLICSRVTFGALVRLTLTCKARTCLVPGTKLKTMDLDLTAKEQTVHQFCDRAMLFLDTFPSTCIEYIYDMPSGTTVREPLFEHEQRAYTALSNAIHVLRTPLRVGCMTFVRWMFCHSSIYMTHQLIDKAEYIIIEYELLLGSSADLVASKALDTVAVNLFGNNLKKLRVEDASFFLVDLLLVATLYNRHKLETVLFRVTSESSLDIMNKAALRTGAEIIRGPQWMTPSAILTHQDADTLLKPKNLRLFSKIKVECTKSLQWVVDHWNDFCHLRSRVTIPAGLLVTQPDMREQLALHCRILK